MREVTTAKRYGVSRAGSDQGRRASGFHCVVGLIIGLAVLGFIQQELDHIVDLRCVQDAVQTNIFDRPKHYAAATCFCPVSDARAIASISRWRVTAASKPGLAGWPSRMLAASFA